MAPTLSASGTNIAHYGAAGPQDNWPLGRGFGRWYGFHGALTDQWNPELYQDNRPIHLRPRETYHLSADLVDHAIGDIRDHKTSAPHRPFLLYLAFGACHFPHHVPREFIEKYRTLGQATQAWHCPCRYRISPAQPGSDALARPCTRRP